jgi:hypothetical protein
VACLDRAFEDEESENIELLTNKSIDLAIVDTKLERAGQIWCFSHQHNLILNNEELIDVKLCDSCIGLMSTPFYSSTQCNFFLQSRCAQLPREKRHQLHPYSLTLFSQVPSCGGLFSCTACEHLNCSFSYRCETCDFDLDLQCCSISKMSMKHECHQQSLFLAVNSNKICHIFNSTSSKKPSIFLCINCDFALDFECATLPLIARKHKYDDHLLKLTYIAKDHCEEYYYLICEQERDPNH